MIQPDKMNAVLKHLNKNKIICLIVFLFFIAKLLTLSYYKVVWWDSAVYIGIGKYIYSYGNAGLWEYTRPVVWPLMLGFLWKIGLNVVLIGRILEIVFGSLCILLTYLIGKKLFGGKAGLLASVFLALSPAFFFFNGIMLTEIISTFFSLAAIYLFVEKKYCASGILLGISFTARFLQLFAFIAIIMALIFTRKNIKNYVMISIGFAAAVIPYLILNQILYYNAFHPFFQQMYLSGNSGWLNHQPISYYFIELFKENLLYPLFIFGAFLLIKDMDTNKKIIALFFTLLFVFFNFIKQKEMRFLIVLLPYMYLLISYSIFVLFKRYKANEKYAHILVILIFTLSIINIFNLYKHEINRSDPYLIFENKVKTAQGNIWVSNPIIPVFTDKKIDKLMYYPFFDGQRKKELIEEAKNADFIFLDTCDLACKPPDSACKNDKNGLLENLKQKLKTAYYSSINECQQFIFQK